MRILRATILGAMLLFASPTIKPQAEKPKVEYNIGFCGGKDFTIIHAEISADEKTLAFTYHLADPTTVVKDKQSLVMDLVVKPEDKEHRRIFDASVLDGKDTLEVHGVLKQNRFVGFFMVNGELGHVMYGNQGDVDAMVKAVDDEFKLCLDLHHVDVKNFPDLLNEFVDNGTITLPEAQN